MAMLNTQICYKDHVYRLQFETDCVEELKEVEHAVQKIKDKYEAIRHAKSVKDDSQISLFDVT